MMKSIFLASMFILQLSLTASTNGDDPLRRATREPEPKNDASGVYYAGVVTALTKTSITLQFEDDPPKCFPVSPVLAAGEIPMTPRLIPNRQQKRYPVSPSEMYRLTDVRLGDWVSVIYSKIGLVVTCDHICIYKRPGGRVPPLPKEAEDLRHPAKAWEFEHPGQKALQIIWDYPTPIPYHEEMNAYWNLQDHGIPYPEKFGDKRRWLTAPMPREVPPKPAPKL